MAERLAHFEMIIVLRLDQLDRLAGRLHRGGEVAALALEFGRLVGAIGYDNRRSQPLDVPLRSSSTPPSHP